MKYFHVDVFSSRPMKGNGLTVVFPENHLSDSSMLEIAQEFRQFETIFIEKRMQDGSFPSRIFTMEEELDFAGHPILGAGGVIHHLFFPDDHAEISLDLSGRIVQLKSSRSMGLYNVTMNQGSPEFINNIDSSSFAQIMDALNLNESDLDDSFPVEVISTGLPYLLVPVKKNLSNCKISRSDFEEFLSAFGAMFVYVFDTRTLECRTWDNFGNTEDVATGSAAGPLCAYLVKNNVKKVGETIQIHQGKYLGRPSIIEGWVKQTRDAGSQEVFINGNVSFFASGSITI